MKKVSVSVAILAIIVTSCSKIEKPKTERVFDVNVNLENDFINIENTRKQYNAHSGEYYSSADTVLKYGAGYVKKIDDTLKGYNLDLVVGAWLREITSPAEGSIAVSVNGKDGVVKDWTGLKVDANNFKVGEWVYVTDTFKYNSQFMNEINEIKIFGLKTEGGDNLDIDDLRIKYIFHK